MAAENATSLWKLFGKSFFIKSKDSGRTNRRAYAVSLAQIRINDDLTHNQYPPMLASGRTAERLWKQFTPYGVL
jgi:hypothetical protein